MKKTLLTALLAGLSVAGFAQSNEKAYIGVSFGSAAPIGDFGETDLEKEGAGMAETGAYFSAEYNAFFNDYIGVGATLGRRLHHIDIDEFAKHMGEAGADEVETTRWRSTFVMANLIVRYPVAEKFSLYAKGSFGTAFNTSPELKAKNELIEVGMTEAKATSVAYGLGGGAKYHFGKVALGLELSYLATQPEFEFKDTDGSTSKIKQQMNTFNTALTVSYSLGKK